MYSLDDIGTATTTSCSYWGSQGQNSLPLIVDTSTGSPDLYNMFGYVEGGYLYVPAMVALDHNLKVVYRNVGWSAGTSNNLINQMLEDCGECKIDGYTIEDSSSSSQSYREFCCEEFGGTFDSNNNCQNSDAQWINLCSECSNDLGDINGDSIINVLDIISVVNIILNVSIPEDCESNSADFNSDGIINIQDIISIVNEVLG